MSETQSTMDGTVDRQKRSGLLLAVIFALVGLAFLAFISYVVIVQREKMDTSDKVLLPLSGVMFVVNLIGFALIRRGRQLTGAWIVYITSLAVFPVAATLVLRDVYLVTGLSVVIFTIIFAREALPPSWRRELIGTAMIVILGIIAIEAWNPGFRVASDFGAAGFGVGVMALAGAGFVFFIVPRLLGGNIRSKIIAGIFLTGAVSVGILSLFAFNRTGSLINTLSERVETSVNLLAEEQLINTVSAEANRADSAFDSAITQVTGLANQLELLQAQKNVLGSGTYWNAGVRLVRFSSGQYYNNTDTPSSVFVPSTVELDEALISELNATAYLDFSAPFVIENNRQITAVYYTNNRGVITYYPNLRLGANLPHDYDGTAQPTFRVATPLFSPDRLPRWAFPRQDPAGTGLVISVSAPVYDQDEFKGVMTADFELNRIAEDISSIRVGRTGYAFLVDSSGLILAMPQQGYEFFGLQPEILEGNAEPRQTIFDGTAVPFEIQQITRRMVVGDSGLVTTEAGGVEYFIAYAPVSSNSFSLGVIVPVEELTGPVIATRNDINSELRAALRNGSFILLALLIGAVLVSLGLSQLIAAPVMRLTETANQILEGDLSARAEVITRDEVGTLAQAFNAMTSRLRATFESLEQSIDERTAQLVEANERNARRAKQFQSIAQVASTISSTLDVENLLGQITTVISHEFGFYHVGVFLLDTAGEYAVLSASNSVGGQTMLANGHRLKVGEKGLVGFVAGTGRPRVALDTGADAVFFNNPNLPNTRSEIALPLRAGGQVIGVLDVQSTEPGAFSQEDMAILSTLADQVGIAIQNARQNEETQKALGESELLSRQFVQAGWSSFTKRQDLLGVRHSGAKVTLLRAKNIQAKETSRGTGQLKPRARGAILSLPIRIRGQIIGKVDVRSPENRQWDQDEIDIVTAIIERAGISMENARLLAESQKRAAKERTIGEISAKISAQSNLEELLRTAALELKRTLPETEVTIQLQSDQDEGG